MIKVIQQSHSGDGVIATSYANDYTIQGKHFLINNIETIAKATTKTFLLDLSNIPFDAGVILDPISIGVNGADITFNLYEGTDYTGGDAVTSFNINRSSDKTAIATMTTSPTGIDKGTLVRQHIAFSTGSGSNITAGTKVGINISILDITKNYLIELVNDDSNNSAVIEYNHSWFEIQEG